MNTSKAGYIYVIQMDGHPYFKIGRTNNVSRRMGEISPQLPTPHRLVNYYAVNDMVRGENILHEEFRKQRMNGEWFTLSEMDLAYIHTNCLYGQAFRLSDRLSLLLSRTVDCALTPYTQKLVRVFARSTKRMERRWWNFMAANRDRLLSSGGTWDEVLDAETIG